MRYFYLDSSVAVRILLGQSAPAARWFDKTTAAPDSTVIASRLLRTELTRVLRREDISVDRRDEILDFIAVVPLTDPVIAQAEAIVPHLKTLDALHLATAIHTGVEATIVTHDATMRSVAGIIGYPTYDPVDSAG